MLGVKVFATPLPLALKITQPPQPPKRLTTVGQSSISSLRLDKLLAKLTAHISASSFGFFKSEIVRPLKTI